MATSSQTTVDQAIQFEFASPGIADRDQSPAEQPLRDGPTSGEQPDSERAELERAELDQAELERAELERAPIEQADTRPADTDDWDDAWIEDQLARRGRWRQPSWPLLCEVAQQYRERRRQNGAAPVIRESAARVADAERRPATRTRFVRRVFALSVLLHTAVVVFMAVWEMPSESVGEGHVLYVLDSERGVGATADPPRLFQFSTSATDVDSLPATPPIDCPVPPPPDVVLANFVESAAGPVVDVRSLLSDRHAAAERALAGPTGAEFFGVQAAGNRFVFLIDCSVTMSVGTKWMEAMRQLTATMERLGEDQWFYVIFFSEESQPMFDTHAPEPHCLPATPENLNRLRRWLLTIKTGMSTQPARTLKLALSLDPDAIYLLSDGDFDPHDPSLDLLARERRNRATDGRSQVAVHTLCFLNSNLSGADKKKLQQIARQNGGSYACVPQGPRAISGTGD